MAARDCIDEIKAAAGGLLNEDDIAVIVEELDRRRRRHMGTPEAVETVDERLFADARRLAAETERADLLERRNALLNKAAKARRQALYRDAGDRPDLAVEALNVGSLRPFGSGSRLSVDARGQALESAWLGGLIADLRREGLLDLWNRGAVSDDVARELWEIRTDDSGRPGITGNREARKIAAIVHKWQRATVDRMNRAGASISMLDGYIVRQGHDPVALRRAGFQAWRDAIVPRLDQERTFGDVDDVDAFLRGAYDGLVSGVHIRADREASDRLFAFKGPGNLAKRASAERVLHFRSADAWLEYNGAYGIGTLEESVLRGIRHAARTAALLEVWGTNPRAAFDAEMDELRERFRDRPEIAARLAPGAMRERQFRVVAGEVDISVSHRLAEISRLARGFQAMSKLGSVLLASFSDIPVRASEMRFQGENLLSSYGNALGDLVKGRRSASEQREIADLVGVGIDGMVGDMAARFATTDGPSGMTSKLLQKFFRLTGLTWWTDAHKTGVGLIMARRLAAERTASWAALPEARQRALAAYGIEAAEWDLIRASPVRDAEGREYLTPGSVRELPEAAVLAWAVRRGEVPNGERRSPAARAQAVERARDALESRIGAYFADRIDHAVLTPGARERAITTWGLQSGTVEGEAVRFFMQFKAFPIAMGTKVWSRELFASGRVDTLGIVHLLLATTVFGYLSQTAKELSRGRSPRDPFDPYTWVAAMAQGGGLGLYGDFLLGTESRFGRGALSEFMGPTFGTVEDALNVWTRARNGEDARAAALRAAIGGMPFANLFYTRAALDYLVIYQAQEYMNPGYLRRFERRVQRTNNQTFFLRPSSVIEPGGGFR